MHEVTKLPVVRVPNPLDELAFDAKGPSEDVLALAFVDAHLNDYRYVAPWKKWITYDGKRWRLDSTLNVYDLTRKLVRLHSKGEKFERATANAAFVSGVERLAHFDQRIVVLPEHLDADPWMLNTQSGMVDLRTGTIRAHDPADLCMKITSASLDPTQGADLFAKFLDEVTQGNAELIGYLQRVMGYCSTGVAVEDIIVFLLGVGANGKSSFAEAIAGTLGDYAKIFSSEVLMEAKGERHPTDVAQFMGVRFALTSEPPSGATWNDSRLKSLTGDATISARFMRGDFFEFKRTHKTMVIGNHKPKLARVSPAIKRRMQMVPFRAVFAPTPGTGMRERLKAEASGAILAWIVEGARLWNQMGTTPAKAVVDLTADYLHEEDEVAQWLDERCTRDVNGTEGSMILWRNYTSWCEDHGLKAKSNKALSEALEGEFPKSHSMLGTIFTGVKLKP